MVNTKVVGFKVVEGYLHFFNGEVSKLVKEGWEPYGNTHANQKGSNTTLYSQAFVLRKPVKAKYECTTNVDASPAKDNNEE